MEGGGGLRRVLLLREGLNKGFVCFVYYCSLLSFISFPLIEKNAVAVLKDFGLQVSHEEQHKGLG